MKKEFDGVPFSDFLKLHPLKPGMKISFKNVEEKLLVGNCTPWETVTYTSHHGWMHKEWQGFFVISVEYDNDLYLTPFQMEVVRDSAT